MQPVCGFQGIAHLLARPCAEWVLADLVWPHLGDPLGLRRDHG